MATNTDELRDDPDTPDPADVPTAGEDVTADEYKEDTRETRWVVLPEKPMKVEIVQSTPFKLLQTIQKHGLDELMEPESVDTDDDGNPVDVDEDALDDVNPANLGKFVSDFVVDRVVTPTVYWGDPPDDAPADAFDLSELGDTDMTTLISALSGQEQGEVNEQFPAGQSEGQRAGTGSGSSGA